jgi:predicted CXXCH cytochrome family protein
MGLISKEDGMRAMVCIIWVVLIFCLTFPARPSCAQDSAVNEEKRYCLKCHGKRESVKKFPDGDFVSAYIDQKVLDKSVHRSLRCTACHKEFSDQRHPNRAFRNKLQYRIKESRGCRDCHADGTIRSRTIHETLFRKERTGEAVVCTNCHNAHAVTSVAGGKVSTSEENYCLGCHAHEKQMVFNSGEAVSVRSIRVNIAELHNSPHRNVRCSDCHFSFSAEDHPRKRFRSEREYRIFSAEICRRCHFDKYSKVSESIHYAMLSAGRLEAPTCIDCHGGHAVSSLSKNRLSVTTKCKTCHGKVYGMYAQSVHGNALFNENNKDVPICIDCHSSHSIKNPTSSDFHDYIPDMCSKCHSDAVLMGKYGLSTDVVKTYLSDFHGVTLNLYRKEAQKRNWYDRPMAVCTDCHGTHGIERVSGADTQVVKKKLLKRCQMCHSNATENFPDAWLSHYKPSLAVTPLVFIVEQFYKIIVPLMVAGLLFQVILHIWRYIIKR